MPVFLILLLVFLPVTLCAEIEVMYFNSRWRQRCLKRQQRYGRAPGYNSEYSNIRRMIMVQHYARGLHQAMNQLFLILAVRRCRGLIDYPEDHPISPRRTGIPMVSLLTARYMECPLTGRVYFIYNKTIFEKAGIDAGKINSYDALVEALETGSQKR